LAPLGLDRSERTLTVHGPSGKVTLLIGGVSRTEMRFATKPPQFPGAPPMKMPVGPVDFRYARLEGNDQVFEIKGEHLGDILLSANALRDPHLARFKADDVRGLTLTHGKSELAFRKEKKDDKERWRMLKPDAGDAEAREITDLVDKLSNLQARDADIIDPDKAKPKPEYGLDQPAVLTVEIEEGKKEDDKEHKKTRQVTFRIGAKEADKGKLYVQVDAWPRINVLEESDKGKP